MSAALAWDAFAAGLGWTAATALMVMLGTFALALNLDVHRVVDVAGGAAFAAVAVVTFGLSQGHGDPGRRWLVTVWWGLFLIACDGGRQAAAVSLVPPLVMSVLLIGGSGKRLLERHMAARPGWDAHAARTSGFFPRLPRRS